MPPVVHPYSTFQRHRLLGYRYPRDSNTSRYIYHPGSYPWACSSQRPLYSTNQSYSYQQGQLSLYRRSTDHPYMTRKMTRPSDTDLGWRYRFHICTGRQRWCFLDSNDRLDKGRLCSWTSLLCSSNLWEENKSYDVRFNINWLVWVLTISNMVACLTFKSIFNKALNLFQFDCELAFNSVPRTNQY